MGVMVLAIGPSKVLAQIQAVFGFVPNVGLVDTSSPFRQLAEPVSETRDGVTLDIKSGFLSADGTIITYAMSDLPVEIKSTRFGDPECFTPAYLILSDGSKIEAAGSSGGPTPDGSYARFGDRSQRKHQPATGLPCLEGTARGKDEDGSLAGSNLVGGRGAPATSCRPDFRSKPVPAQTATQPQVESGTPASRR